ncbi:hypothetical protein BpHYR1_047194 [Brachionus plicatilis]|uniref:Uncharacterized protein n=1 Tax=Brachionus plicatilis TaxID=10195 RepID=A0A3M7P5X9_BRAPC|nr:hypothetical protein BpHYR1_047194 [Brachionus plicatilis]
MLNFFFIKRLLFIILNFPSSCPFHSYETAKICNLLYEFRRENKYLIFLKKFDFKKTQYQNKKMINFISFSSFHQNLNVQSLQSAFVRFCQSLSSDRPKHVLNNTFIHIFPITSIVPVSFSDKDLNFILNRMFKKTFLFTAILHYMIISDS